MESIISKHATGEISIFKLVSVAEETGLSLAFSETLKTGFVASRSNYFTLLSDALCIINSSQTVVLLQTGVRREE